MKSTYLGIVLEFDCAEIRLEDMCEKYLGLDPATAKRRAALGKLEVKAYRPTSSQKSGWLVSAADLAEHLDKMKGEAA